MKPVVVLGISLLFLVMSFGTVTGLYQLDLFVFNVVGDLLTQNANINFMVMFLGVVGVVYYLFQREEGGER